MPPRSNVPCNGCKACCQGGEFVVLFPEAGDDVARYEHNEIKSDHGLIKVLKHKPNGDCIYLSETGCSIHTTAPAVCRAFDCRTYFLSLTRDERRIHKRVYVHKGKIFQAGNARLTSLTPTEAAEAINSRGKSSDAPTARKRLRDMLLSEKSE